MPTILSHPAISAHQWVADNPVVGLSFSIFPAFRGGRAEKRGINADFYHCFSSPPKERKKREIHNISGAASETMTEKDVIPPQHFPFFGGE